jgi:signal transduction histidine kinase
MAIFPGFSGRFIEPRSSDEDDRRHERILNVILVGSILMLAIFDALVFYYTLKEGAAYQNVSFIWFSVIVAFFVFLYALSRRGFFIAASYLLVIGYLVSISYAAYRWGVNMPSALLACALVITMASILISTRVGFIVLTIVSAGVLILWHFQFYDILPPLQYPSPNNSDGLVFVILFALITTVAWLSNREIERSLDRARGSERELKNERDLLEIRVEERTEALRAAQIERIDHLYRFAEFGELASGLFHDLLNLLNVVSLDAEKNGMERGLEKVFSVQKEIELFREAVRKQLQRNDEEEGIFSLKESLEIVIRLLSYRAKQEGIVLILECESGGDGTYVGNPFKFHQVCMNLILNAIESFDRSDQRKRMVLVRLIKSDRDSWRLEVADNGSGISADVQAKIFEPFFTTKQGEKKGIGIGLAITKRIIEKDLHGNIEIESDADNDGRGTKFIIEFPNNGKNNRNRSAGGSEKVSKSNPG